MNNASETSSGSAGFFIHLAISRMEDGPDILGHWALAPEDAILRQICDAIRIFRLVRADILPLLREGESPLGPMGPLDLESMMFGVRAGMPVVKVSALRAEMEAAHREGREDRGDELDRMLDVIDTNPAEFLPMRAINRAPISGTMHLRSMKISEDGAHFEGRWATKTGTWDAETGIISHDFFLGLREDARP